EDVEDRPYAELAPHADDRAHGRMQLRSEEKRDAGATEDLAHARRVEVDGHAELREEVGAAARRGDRAVAVLGHQRAAARGDERRDRRDVERPTPVAAG